MFLRKYFSKTKQHSNHDPEVDYYRDEIRPQILETQPTVSLDSEVCEVHVLTSSNDILNLFWALKTFYFFSGKNYKLCIHDDGTLTSKNLEEIKYHFPGARVVLRKDADATVLDALAKYPNCFSLRKDNLLSLKLFDFKHYLTSERMLLLDSDVLFFKEPSGLLNRIEDPFYKLNSVNSGLRSVYTVDPVAASEILGFQVIEKFNSGLGLIHAESLNPDWIEDFLTLPDIIGHFWRIEQTLYTLCSSKFGTELLPEEYTISLQEGIADRPSRHYVGQIRHLMYKEGMKQLVKDGFLSALNR